MKRILPYLAGLLFALPFEATAQVVQPTYTRPSKGASITVFDTTAISAVGTTRFTSAVYDMTAFSEVNIEVTIVQPGAGTATYRRLWAGGKFGRYIRMNVTITQGVVATYMYGGFQAADAPTGPFSRVAGAGSLETIVNDPNLPITSLKMVVTPIPFENTVYQKPSNGDPSQIYRGMPTAGGFIYSTAFFDMSNYNALIVNVVNSNLSNECKYGINLVAYGGPTTTEPFYDTIRATGAVARFREDGGTYYIPAASRYIYISISGYEYNYPAPPTTCTDPYIVTVTPVVDYPQDTTYRVTIGYDANEGISNVAGIETQVYLPLAAIGRVRLQNLGTGGVKCRVGIKTSPDYSITLAPETGGVPGSGGSYEFVNIAFPIFCTTAGGGASTVGVLSY